MKTSINLLKGYAAQSLFVLAATCMGSLNASADRVYWDFTTPLSTTTIAQLKADSNWKNSGETTVAEDGTPRSWTNATKITAGPMMANGELIPEYEGIEMTTTGTTKSGDYRIGIHGDAMIAGMASEDPSLWPGININPELSRFRLGRSNMTFKFATLKAGDKVTVTFMSAKPWGNPEDSGRCFESDQMTPISGFPGTGTKEEYFANKLYVVTFEVKPEFMEPTDIYLRATAGVDLFKLSINGATSNSTDIKDVIASPSEVVATEYFNLSGVRVSAPAEGGLYILRTRYADGSVVATKEIR